MVRKGGANKVNNMISKGVIKAKGTFNKGVGKVKDTFNKTGGGGPIGGKVAAGVASLFENAISSPQAPLKDPLGTLKNAGGNLVAGGIGGSPKLARVGGNVGRRWFRWPH